MPPSCSRRDFFAGLLGFSVATPALLDGCRARTAAPRAGSEELGPIERELNLYNWSDYIAPEIIPAFEREFAVRVTYDTFESSEEMVAKLQAGARGYDLVVPPTYGVTTLLASGLLAPLSPRYLPNRANLAPVFRGLAHDREDRYTVPWQWGMTGIAWRTDRIPATPDSWAVFLEPRYRGKLTMLDDLRDVIGAFLRLRGHSINSRDPAELEEARRDAVAAKANLKAYLSAPVKGQLIAGDVWLAQLWNGDAAQAAREQPALAWVLPKEGGTLWIDSLVVPAAAPHPRAAHEFINFILRPEIGAAISTATGYGTPNQAAMPLLEKPVPYPSPNELARLEIQEELGRATELWDEIWTRIKSA
ncbi:MAG TPA: spermidine/putrescine ABC transporter substrate-binding protein [Gemmatimonadales bacterium]|jgi:spermidine/putrescine-binding protein|nr:spermidine/putrescine ABC transporter substrate-binding protein [Gemmatimonadales bacterium]